MGKCVDQVYFVEQWNKRQELKISIKLEIPLYNFSSVSENCVRLKAYFLVTYCYSLREKCPYSQLFWSAFSRSRTEYGEIAYIVIDTQIHFHILIRSALLHIISDRKKQKR